MLDNISGDKYYEMVATLYPALRKVSETPIIVKGIRAQRAKAAAEAKLAQDVSLALQGAQVASETDPNAGLLGALTGTIGAPPRQ